MSNFLDNISISLKDDSKDNNIVIDINNIEELVLAKYLILTYEEDSEDMPLDKFIQTKIKYDTMLITIDNGGTEIYPFCIYNINDNIKLIYIINQESELLEQLKSIQYDLSQLEPIEDETTLYKDSYDEKVIFYRINGLVKIPKNRKL